MDASIRRHWRCPTRLTAAANFFAGNPFYGALLDQFVQLLRSGRLPNLRVVRTYADPWAVIRALAPYVPVMHLPRYSVANPKHFIDMIEEAVKKAGVPPERKQLPCEELSLLSFFGLEKEEAAQKLATYFPALRRATLLVSCLLCAPGPSSSASGRRWSSSASSSL